MSGTEQWRMERWGEKGNKKRNCTAHSLGVWEREIAALESVCLCAHASRGKEANRRETVTQGQRRRERVPCYCWWACVQTDGKLSAYCSFISGGGKNITIYLGWETLCSSCNGNLLHCAAALAINWGAKCWVTIRRVGTWHTYLTTSVLHDTEWSWDNDQGLFSISRF